MIFFPLFVSFDDSYPTLSLILVSLVGGDAPKTGGEDVGLTFGAAGFSPHNISL